MATTCWGKDCCASIFCKQSSYQHIHIWNCCTCHHQLADQEAVVILEKTPIREDTLAELFSGSRLKLEMKNDIYSTYRLQAPSHLNGAVRKNKLNIWTNKQTFQQPLWPARGRWGSLCVSVLQRSRLQWCVQPQRSMWRNTSVRRVSWWRRRTGTIGRSPCPTFRSRVSACRSVLTLALES